VKKVPSWLIESFVPTGTRFDDIIGIAVGYKNELNENDRSELDTFLSEMRENGWYPFVTKICEDASMANSLDYVYNIPKDEHIWQLLMLEKECKILEDFGCLDVSEVKAKIKHFKGLL